LGEQASRPCADGAGGRLAQVYAATHRVFKGVKALGVQPGGRLGAALKAFVVEPPAVAGGTDPHQFFLSGAAFSASLSFSMARFSMRET
jgi:hypothetical protein